MRSDEFPSSHTFDRTRDSTLRAIVLSCRKNFRFYFPALLENVTINVGDLISIQDLFQREDYGHLVKSLHLARPSIEFSETKKSLLLNDITAISGLSSSIDLSIRYNQGLGMILTSIFRNAPAIETLIIEPSRFIDGLFSERHTFLTNSLKKLYINKGSAKEKHSLSARNSIWLLLFVPQIQEAALGIALSVTDLGFLLEFGDAVEGLSQISKLSLDINFVWNDEKSETWWGSQEESYRHSAQGDQKTFAVSQLLRCVNTSQLVSLEIVGNLEDQRDGDKTRLLVECLTVLHHSFNSLLHLRLFGLTFREDRPDSKCFSNFKAIKMLTLEGHVLQALQMCDHVSSSLEVVWLPYYTDKQFHAEDFLIQFIKRSSPSLPRLREVVVPKSPVLLTPAVIGNVRKWTSHRERLEKEELFRSGKVNLRKAGEDDMSE